MPRLAWFTPLPPVRSGIARDCSELLHGFGEEYDIDLFVEGPPACFESSQVLQACGSPVEMMIDADLEQHSPREIVTA